MSGERLRDMTATALMAALLCVLGPIMIPIGVIPFSLQVLAVYLAVYALGMGRGTVAVIVYLLMGCVGLPVFAGFSGGAARLIAPAGGFLVGFIPLAMISGWAIDHFEGRLVLQFVGMFVGLVVLYVLGTAWLAYSAGLTLNRALQAAVYPFVAVDTVKILCAMLLGRALRSRLKKAIK